MPTVPQENFPFCGPSYPAESAVFDCQRSINLYPEFGLPSSKSHTALIGTPGLRLFMTVPQSPMRSLWAGSFDSATGRLFAAAGSHAYELDPTGVVLQDYGSGLGTGLERCTFKENGTQLLVCAPSSGIYNLNPIAHTLDLVFDGTALEYLDGFYVALARPTFPTQNIIAVSAPLDGTTWPGLAIAQRTGSADLVTQIAVINGQLWIFGLKKIEVWGNAGLSPFPFARIPNATIDQGLLAVDTVAKLDNSLFWLGADDRGYAVVYRNNGLSPVRVSSSAIESLIKKQYGSFISTASAFAYQESGHTFYVLNFNAQSAFGFTAQAGGTVVYDVTTGQWHERSYLNGVNPERARAHCFASLAHFLGSAPAGLDNTPHNFVGDYANGNIYVQDIAAVTDNGQPIRRTRIAPHISNSNRWIKYKRFTLDADIGTATPILDYSNDGGRTFANGTPTYTLTKSGESTPGGFGRYYQDQIGRSRDRAMRVTITDSANPIRLINGYIDAKPGTEA